MKNIKVVKAIVEIYNKYLNGEVYGYKLIEETFCKCCNQTKKEDVDSCWGFYDIEDIKNDFKSELI